MHVLGQLAGLGDFERLEPRPENAAIYITGLDPRAANPHERRQVKARIEPVAGHDAPPCGIGNRRLNRIAGPHQLNCPKMVPLIADHRADQGDLVEHLGRLRPVLADLNPRHIGADRLRRPLKLRAGLGIERVVLAGPAVHPKQDHFLAALLERISFGQKQIAPAIADRAGPARHGQRLQKPAPTGNTFRGDVSGCERAEHIDIPSNKFSSDDVNAASNSLDFAACACTALCYESAVQARAAKLLFESSTSDSKTPRYSPCSTAGLRSRTCARAWI